MSDFFPAESMPAQCCYRFADDSRCTLDRTTHSFCEAHAQQIRRSRPSPTAQGPEEGAKYSYGHCAEKRKPGGCQLHNLQCGAPDCDRREIDCTPSAKAGAVSEIDQQLAEIIEKRYTSNLDGEDVRWLIRTITMLRSTPAPDVPSHGYEIADGDDYGCTWAVLRHGELNAKCSSHRDALAVVSARLAEEATAATPAPAPDVQELAKFDAAISAELPRVSHVEYDSHEICKHFASKVRERMVRK